MISQFKEKFLILSGNLTFSVQWGTRRTSRFPFIAPLLYPDTPGNLGEAFENVHLRKMALVERRLGGIKWAFDLSRSYHRLQVRFGGVCRCMQVYAGVGGVNLDLSCLGRMIYARQFLSAKLPTQFLHRRAEKNHSDHLYWPWAGQSVA